MKAIITVVGKDTVGILATISGKCADYKVNVLEVTQSILQDMFCMIMLIDLKDCTIPYTDFSDKITEEGTKKNLVVHVMHEDIFNSMHRI